MTIQKNIQVEKKPIQKEVEIENKFANKIDNEKLPQLEEIFSGKIDDNKLLQLQEAFSDGLITEEEYASIMGINPSELNEQHLKKLRKLNIKFLIIKNVIDSIQEESEKNKEKEYNDREKPTEKEDKYKKERAALIKILLSALDNYEDVISKIFDLSDEKINFILLKMKENFSDEKDIKSKEKIKIQQYKEMESDEKVKIILQTLKNVKTNLIMHGLESSPTSLTDKKYMSGNTDFKNLSSLSNA